MSDDDSARQGQLIEELHNPSSLAGHVDAYAHRSLRISVTDEIGNEYAKAAAREPRCHLRPEMPGSGEPVQQENRWAFPVVFEAHAHVA